MPGRFPVDAESCAVQCVQRDMQRRPHFACFVFAKTKEIVLEGPCVPPWVYLHRTQEGVFTDGELAMQPAVSPSLQSDFA